MIRLMPNSIICAEKNFYDQKPNLTKYPTLKKKSFLELVEKARFYVIGAREYQSKMIQAENVIFCFYIGRFFA